MSERVLSAHRGRQDLQKVLFRRQLVATNGAKAKTRPYQW